MVLSTPTWRSVRFAFAIFIFFWSMFAISTLTGLGNRRRFKKLKNEDKSFASPKIAKKSSLTYIPDEYFSNSSKSKDNFLYILEPNFKRACGDMVIETSANGTSETSSPSWQLPLFNVVLVHSRADHFEHRKVIRETWGSLGKRLSKIAFLLGDPRNKTTQEKLVKESRLYGDILQEDHYESYRNITLKAVMGLKWVAEHCPRATFVTKCDDDMYLSVRKIMNAIVNKVFPRRDMLLCHAIKGASVYRYGKYAVPWSLYSEPKWPDFCFGGCWIASGDVIRTLYRTSLMTRQIYLDDVYVTGILRRKSNIRITKIATVLFCHGRGSPQRVREMWDGQNRTDSTLKVYDCFR